jgi:threonyl-tRNA synthetase
VAIAPIGDAHLSFAKEVAGALEALDMRVLLMEEGDSLGKKIRTAKTERIPYTLVIGDAEVAGKKVTLESRDKGKIGECTLAELLERLAQEVINKK